MTQTLSKKLVGLLLAFAMIFSLASIAEAKDQPMPITSPTTHTLVATPDTINYVTVEGATAYYEKDDNTGNRIYIRALAAGKTEYDLRSAALVIELNDASTQVSSPTITFSGTGTTRTATVNLLNKSYKVTIGGIEYVLAAGLPTGQVGIHANDPLSMGTVQLNSTTMTVYGYNVQNPFMGNPTAFAAPGWTFVNYYISGVLPIGTNMSSVSATYSLASGATLSGAGANNVTSTGCTFDFTQGNIITVTNGSHSRSYDAQLAVSGQSVLVQEDPVTGYRNYDINFDELMDSNYYTGLVATKADEILDALEAYLATPHIFDAGVKVMEVLEDFIDWAETTNEFTYSSNTGNGTYLSVLNGLSYSDCGSNAGYMYTNDPYGWYWNSQTDHSSIPMVGAGDKVFNNGDRIVWFYTVDYFNWF